MTNSYTDKDIKSLENLEHIRKRPGMYIGALGDGSSREDGIYVLLKEVLDNSIDEFVMKNGDTIEVECSEYTVRVRDYGRGIPQKSLIDCVSKMNTGAKFSQDVFKYSIGLNGVGLKAVNALSKSFEARSYRDGVCFSCKFEQGNLIGKKTKKISEDETGTEIIFTPDDSKGLFENYSYNLQIISEMLYDYAYLNTGLTLIFNGKKIKSRYGLKDLLETKIGSANKLYDIAHYTNKDKSIEIAFTHMVESVSEDYYSFANGQYTLYGGTHQSYFKEGLYKGFVAHFGKDWSAQDVREGIIASIAIKIDEPFFDSQTKSKLTNTNIKNDIIEFTKESVVDFLLKNPKSANDIKDKINQAEKAHHEIQEIKKQSKVLQNKFKLNVPKLKDCKYHLNDRNKKDRDKGQNSMLFICEGDSAAGSFVTTRNTELQAVFPIRGKTLNVVKKKNKSTIYTDETLFNIISALGIENELDNLRYSKIIIATDADNDGYHIRLLLLTFFIIYYPELVKDKRVFILETPLFKVRNKSVIEYCYNDLQRNEALERIKGAEVTRFKGLGEIDASDFRKFISDDMKLTQVSIDSVGQVEEAIKFYMGDNTPERKDFITENLIDDV